MQSDKSDGDSRQLKAIPTVYNGIQLKSRMESKCALLLDKLGWKWEYEPFSVMLDGVNYTPDFYIPALGYIVECRGYESELGAKQISRFAAHVAEPCEISGRPIRRYIVIGPDDAITFESSKRRLLEIGLCRMCGGWVEAPLDCGCLASGDARRLIFATVQAITADRGSIYVQSCFLTRFPSTFGRYEDSPLSAEKWDLHPLRWTLAGVAELDLRERAGYLIKLLDFADQGHIANMFREATITKNQHQEYSLLLPVGLDQWDRSAFHAACALTYSDLKLGVSVLEPDSQPEAA